MLECFTKEEGGPFYSAFLRKANWQRCMRSFINPFTASRFQFCISRMGEGPRCHSGAWVLHVVCLKKTKKQALYPQRL